MTRILIGLLIIVAVAFGSNNRGLVNTNSELINKYYNELNSYSLFQLEAMKFGYIAGSRYDIGYTMAAIIMEESQAGKQMLNLTGDYGLCGINIKYYLKDLGLRHTKYNEVEIATLLIRNDALNIHVGVSKFRHWLKESKGDFIKAWAMYNGGYTANFYYANRIYNRIKAIRKYERIHPYVLKDVVGMGGEW